MENIHNILHYGNAIHISKELKSYMLNAMNEYKKKFEKNHIQLLKLEDNMRIIKSVNINEEQNSNEEIFLKIQRRKLCPFDLFNLSLLFPLKIDTKNEKPYIQLVSDETNIIDVERVQTVFKSLEQNKMDKLKFFQAEYVIKELLDEIIRQVTVECQKRGLALILINNELDKQIYQYKNLIKIIENNNELNLQDFIQMQEQHKSFLEVLSNEEKEWKEKIADLKYELDILKNKNKKKLQENLHNKEAQYDLLKHNELLLEKNRETYDRKGEI